MGKPIATNEVLKHPARRAVLEHIARSGEATAISIGTKLGIQRRGCLANHTNRLAKFGLICCSTPR